MGLSDRLATGGTAPRRRSRYLIGAAAALVLALIGAALVLTFSSHHRPSDSALEPIGPASAPDSESSTESSDLSGGLAMGLPRMPDGLSAEPGGPADQVIGAPASTGGGGVSSLQLPPLPQLPPPPGADDWSAFLQPVLESQANSAAANIGDAITGAAAGIGTAAMNSAAVLLGDLILYNAYTDDGSASLSALPPAAALEAAAARLSQLPPPDFSGLSAAFAAAATQPPVLGLPPGPLPTPPQLPPPPTPEQVAALAALPFLIPALPPLPPPPPLIGLPPPPPPIPLPSITRLLGLPF